MDIRQAWKLCPWVSHFTSERGFFICKKGCFSVISLCVGNIR